MWSIIAVGFFNSVMFPTIFTLGIDGLGKMTGKGSGLLVMGDRGRSDSAGDPRCAGGPLRRAACVYSARGAVSLHHVLWVSAARGIRI